MMTVGKQNLWNIDNILRDERLFFKIKKILVTG